MIKLNALSPEIIQEHLSKSFDIDGQQVQVSVKRTSL